MRCSLSRKVLVYYLNLSLLHVDVLSSFTFRQTLMGCFMFYSVGHVYSTSFHSITTPASLRPFRCPSSDLYCGPSLPSQTDLNPSYDSHTHTGTLTHSHLETSTFPGDRPSSFHTNLQSSPGRTDLVSQRRTL